MKQNVRIWTGLNWLRSGSCGESHVLRKTHSRPLKQGESFDHLITLRVLKDPVPQSWKHGILGNCLHNKLILIPAISFFQADEKAIRFTSGFRQNLRKMASIRNKIARFF